MPSGKRAALYVANPVPKLRATPLQGQWETTAYAPGCNVSSALLDVFCQSCGHSPEAEVARRLVLRLVLTHPCVSICALIVGVNCTL